VCVYVCACVCYWTFSLPFILSYELLGNHLSAPNESPGGSCPFAPCSCIYLSGPAMSNISPDDGVCVTARTQYHNGQNCI